MTICGQKISNTISFYGFIDRELFDLSIIIQKFIRKYTKQQQQQQTHSLVAIKYTTTHEKKESHTTEQRSFVTHQKKANLLTHRHFFDHLNQIHFLSYPATCPKLYANRQILAIKLCSLGFFVGCALLVADLSVILRILISCCGFSQVSIRPVLFLCTGNITFSLTQRMSTTNYANAVGSLN